MVRRLLALFLVIGVGELCRAQDVSERLLPPRTQLYLRWDGIDAHRNAFEKSALGKMMAGDTGIFLRALVHHLEKQVDALADDLSPDFIALVKEIPALMEAVGKNGLRLGVEFRHVSPLEAEVMLVFPKSARADSAVFSTLRKALKLGGLKSAAARGGGRSAKADQVLIRWWTRGQDAVILLRIELQRTTGHTGPLARFMELDLYKQLKAFREFPAWADGFVDAAALTKLAGDKNAAVKRLMADLGLDALKSITFHSGPDGPCEHCVIQFELPGPRNGLLRAFLTRKPVLLADLPPLPADQNSFFVSRLDPSAFFDAVLKGVEGGIRIAKPGQEDVVKQSIALAENLLGLKLRDDLFGSLDDLVVRYNSPADGPFGFGTVYLIKVKNADRLQSTLTKLASGIGRLPLMNVRVTKTTYHGVAINEIRLGDDSYRELPSFAIHQGWLAYSTYPQPIRGFILRANGQLPAWKLEAELTRRLAEFPKEYVAIAVSDPRPAIKTLFSLGPTAAGMINNLAVRLGPQARFDLSLLPNAHEATRHLFRNITVITDDGRRVRMEMRASVLAPF